MEDTKRAGRRRHSAELKAKVVAACSVRGVSVAQVALTHGLNANLVHKWRRQSGGGDGMTVPMRDCGAFIPLTLPAYPGSVAGDIRIELRRGTTAVNVTWPLAGAVDCAAWMRELLR